MKRAILLAAAAVLTLGIAACEVKGPAKQGDGKSSYNSHSSSDWLSRSHAPPAGR